MIGHARKADRAEEDREAELCEAVGGAPEGGDVLGETETDEGRHVHEVDVAEPAGRDRDCGEQIRQTEGDEERVDLPLKGNGYNYEAAEVGRCLRANLKQSDVMPLDETLALMELMDSIRARWGLSYPME